MEKWHKLFNSARNFSRFLIFNYDKMNNENKKLLVEAIQNII